MAGRYAGYLRPFCSLAICGKKEKELAFGEKEELSYEARRVGVG
jgi:hypothetical protein